MAIRRKYTIDKLVWVRALPCDIECEHGWDVCPRCDAGTIEVTKTWLIKNLGKRMAKEIVEGRIDAGPRHTTNRS